MDQQNKKLSLLEYRKTKAAKLEGSLSVENISTENSVESTTYISQNLSPTYSVNSREEIVNSSLNVEPSSPYSEVNQKLSQMLDKNMHLIPDRILHLPTLMKSYDQDDAKISILRFIQQMKVIEKVPEFGENEFFRNILYNWLKLIVIEYETRSNATNSLLAINRQLLFLLFENILAIPFTHEYFMNSKFPKILTKICEIPDDDIQKKAKDLLQKWNYRKSKSSEPIPPGSLSFGADQIPENANLSSKRTFENLPSANDSSVHDQSKSIKRKPKKRVSFAPDELLVQIKYFELDDSDNSNVFYTKKSNYHESEREEASYAFDRAKSLDKPQIEWKTPTILQSIPDDCIINRGAQSKERLVQEERENKVLSVTYFSLQHVPASPAECINESVVPEGLVPLIPIFEVVNPNLSTSESSIKSIDPNALANLIKNSDLLKVLNKK